jgi:penicillin-binding protein 1A
VSPDRRSKRPLVARRPATAGTERPRAPRARTRGGSGGGPLRRLLRAIGRSVGAVLRLVGRLVWGLFWRVALVVAAVIGGIAWYDHAQLPPVETLLDARMRGSVTLLDHEGDVFAWRGEVYGGQVTAGDVSPHLVHAVVATEDRRFYYHFGISPRGIASAIRINLSEGRGPFSGNGGSTITQQVAKLLCLGKPYDAAVWKSEADYEADCRKGSIMRKLREVPYAIALEARYSKEEILTIYLNRAYLGAGARGFEAAAQRYFGKSARRVDPAEAAMLAGLLIAPSYYAPTNNIERAQGRAEVILGLMAREGYLTSAELDAARAAPARLSRAAEARAGGYFADWVMETGPAFLTRATTEDVEIRTTLDRHIQRAAESALERVFAEKVREGSTAQAAIVVMSSDGAVRAMVGGRASDVAGSFNRATQARRQTGSAFKPFVFAAALDLGYSPADYVEDSPLTVNVRGSGPWTPKNYDEEFRGMVTLTEALAQSLNIPAVRVSEAVGRANVRRVAAEFGLSSDLAAGPALALGVSEATLLEMTGAYAGILNGGSAVVPYGLVDLRIKGESQSLIGQAGGMGERVISERAAQELVYMMTEVIRSGTGARASLGERAAAGKTGTTQSARDAWFVGFTADYVAGVWIGYDDNRPLSGVTGATLPADIWRETMIGIHEGMAPRPLPALAPEPRRAPAAGSSPSVLDSASGETGTAPPASDGAARATGETSGPAADPIDQLLRDVRALFGGSN